MMGLVQGTGWHWEGMFMGIHWLWWFFLVSTGVGLIWALWRALADDRGTRRTFLAVHSAEETLRDRFAKGEIDEEEYTRRLDALRRT